MSNNTTYLISEQCYETTVMERVALYNFVRQLVFQVKRAATMDDLDYMKEMAAHFGQQADKLFANWEIPERFLIYGNTEDLNDIKELELLELYESDEDDDEDDAPVLFFDQMDELILESKRVTAQMELVLAELDSALEPLRNTVNDME